MSPAAAHRIETAGSGPGTSGRIRHVCCGCRARRVRFQHRGVVRADRDHDLCFRCYRAESERLRARLLREAPRPAPLKMGLARNLPRAGSRDLIARA